MSFETVLKPKQRDMAKSHRQWDKNGRMWFVSRSEDTVFEPIIHKLRQSSKYWNLLVSVCVRYPHSTIWWIKHTPGVMCPSQGKAQLMFEQAVQGIWYTLLICDSFVKDSVYYWSFFLSITKHLEVAGGDFHHLVFAACRVKALSSWTVALISFFFHLLFTFCFPSSKHHASDGLTALCSCSLHCLVFFLPCT